MKCKRCSTDKPRACFGSYTYTDKGNPKTRADYYCLTCRAAVDARLMPARVKGDEARAQGYATAGNTPEYKRAQRRRAAETEGRELVPLFARYADGIAHRVKRAFIAELRRQWDEALIEPSPEVARKAMNDRRRKEYWRDPDKFRAKASAYKHSNPDARVKWDANRADKQAALSDGSLTVDAIRALFAASKSCLYCGHDYSKWRRSMDHLDPLSKGGSHSIVNVVICCIKCNRAKRAAEFRSWVGRLKGEFAIRAARLYRQRYGKAAFEQCALFSNNPGS